MFKDESVMFEHNKWKHDLTISFYTLLLSLGVFAVLLILFNKTLDFKNWYNFIVCFVIISLIGPLLKVPEDYSIRLDGHQLTGASSYRVFRKIFTINLNKPFAIKKKFILFSLSEEYRVQQDDKTIYFSKLAIGKKDTQTLLNKLSEYPHVKLY